MTTPRNRKHSDVSALVRRVLLAVIIVAAVAALIFIDRREVVTEVLSTEAVSAAPEFRSSARASTWFCPGVPGNDKSISGLLFVSNFGETPVGGTITRFAQDGVPRGQRFAIPARTTLQVDAVAGVNSPFVSVLVESQGAPIAVEQRTFHRAGDAVTPCASSPSSSWFLADGFTGADSLEQVVVTNPSLDSAILDVTFVTASGERSPQSLKGVVIPPESLRVFDMATLDARNEATVAVSVKSTVGRVIVGRSQHYLGRGRLGYTMALAASGTSDRWFFADGDKAEQVSEEFVIFNPRLVDQQLTFIISGDDGAALDPLVVTAPARRVTKFAPTTLGALASGRYSTVITATSSDGSTPAGVVVERVTTRRVEKSTASAVVLGAPQSARSWIAPSGTAVGIDDSLRIFNPGAVSAVFRISYLGPAGDVAVAGYEEVSLAPGASTSVNLPIETDSTTVSVTASEPIVVQRRVSRGLRQVINGAAPLILRTEGTCPVGENC